MLLLRDDSRIEARRHTTGLEKKALWILGGAVTPQWFRPVVGFAVAVIGSDKDADGRSVFFVIPDHRCRSAAISVVLLLPHRKSERGEAVIEDRPDFVDVALLGVRLVAVSSLSCGRKVGVEPVGDASGLVDHLRRVASGPVRGGVIGVVVGGGLLAEPCRRCHYSVVLLVGPQEVHEFDAARCPALFGEFESEGQQVLVVGVADMVRVQLSEEKSA